MHKYILSDQEYLVESSEQLLEEVKNENEHTKKLSLQDYMDNVAAKVINSLTDDKIDLPAKADDIVRVWKKVGVIS